MHVAAPGPGVPSPPKKVKNLPSFFGIEKFIRDSSEQIADPKLNWTYLDTHQFILRKSAQP